jgi:hypothetical protein
MRLKRLTNPDFYTHRAPPGYDLHPEWTVFLLSLLGAWLYNLTFYLHYGAARDALYGYDAIREERFLIEGARIAPFREVLSHSLAGFAVAAAILLCFVIGHYLSYRQGSRSIYLMRRLPKSFERHRRAWTLPLLACLAFALCALLLLLLHLCFYLVFTPNQCLPPQGWQNLWGLFP